MQPDVRFCITALFSSLFLVSCGGSPSVELLPQLEKRSVPEKSSSHGLHVQPNPQEYDRVCSGLFRRFEELEPGIRLTAVASFLFSDTWVMHSIIKSTSFQTGRGKVRFERGTSVFTIWPFVKDYDNSQIGFFWCISIKIDAPGLKASDIIAILGGKKASASKVIEFELHSRDRHPRTVYKSTRLRQRQERRPDSAPSQGNGQPKRQDRRPEQTTKQTTNRSDCRPNAQ